jgi:hypothetical protein
MRTAWWDLMCANLLGLSEGLGLGEEPTDSRLLKALKPFTLKPPSLGLFAPFLRSNLRLPLDHPRLPALLFPHQRAVDAIAGVLIGWRLRISRGRPCAEE